jgi:uncharacterized repeat protein (TIGR01451 family)
MTEKRSDSVLFAALAKELLSANLGVRFQARGRSMTPAIRDEEFIHVQPAAPETLGRGDVVLFSQGPHFLAHRIVKTDAGSGLFVTQGDCTMQADGEVTSEQILGKIVAAEDAANGSLRCIPPRARRGCGGARLYRAVVRIGRRALAFAGIVGLFLVLSWLQAAGQVAVDSTSTPGTKETAATTTISVSHTTGTGQNLFLLVGVSINTRQNTTTTVSGVTYNGTNLYFIGAHNDTNSYERVELWGMTAPAPGTNTIVVTVNLPGTGEVGVVVNATTFTGVNLSQPLTSFVANDDAGTAGTTGTALTISSQTNGLAVDVLAAQGSTQTTTITKAASETQLWNTSSGTHYTYSVVGFAGDWAGASSVSISETFNHNAYWSRAAVAIQPASSSAVSVDATTSATASLTGSAPSLTFAHTNASTCTNCFLLVGVSMNITSVPAAQVLSATYNGVAMKFIGAQVDASSEYRVEQWGLVAPATGAADNVVLNFSALGTSTVGVAAAAIDFSGVDQYQPTGTPGYNYSNGTATNYDWVDIPSGVTAITVDTLATASAATVTAGLGETQYWTGASTGSADNVKGAVNTHVGTTLTDMYDTLSASEAWALMGVSLNPTQTDVGVTVSSSGAATYPCASCITYTATVENYGPDPATGVTLAESLSSSGLSVVSITPSVGTCTGTYPTYSCSLGTMAVNATATVTIVATPTASGGFFNTATVSIASPTDYNTTNNSATVLASAEAVSCTDVPTPPTGGTLTGIVNTYYPGAASAAAKATSLSLGTPTGNTTAGISAGSLLLVIQMQGASINSTNTSAYGNGANGGGFTAVNNVGLYEYVTATSALAAGASGTVNIQGAGPNGGLMYGYTATPWSATGGTGQSTFQVIVVPQYATATLGSGLTALPWNGSTGGVLALNVNGLFNLNGGTASVSGLGFRGGAGLELGGDASTTPLPATGDFVFTSPATYTQQCDNSGSGTTTVVGAHGVKGEGIAGTPSYVQQYGTETGTYTCGGNTDNVYASPISASGGATLWYNSTVSPNGLVSVGPYATGSDYPYSTYSTTGSMGRGAPGNAGGGGTDDDPATAPSGGNDRNSGAGGGGNGGQGGAGGDSWYSDVGIGGLGGSSFPATLNQVVMGGGGGGGTRNNESDVGNTQVGFDELAYASAGAPGGGIIMIVAGGLTGTGTFYADGASAYGCSYGTNGSGYTTTCNGTANDAGGGGGAGGSIIILSQGGGESGLTLSAQGGAGGSAWANDTNATKTLADRHGPGGGGGGGALFISGMPASYSVSGGAHAWTNNSSQGGPYQYGATNGGAGIAAFNAQALQLSGIPGGTICSPDVISAASHLGTTGYGGSFIRGMTGALIMDAGNASPYGTTSGAITLSDTVPAGLTPTAASGAGWSCSISGQEVACICPSCSLAPSTETPPVNITVNVLQTAAAALTNKVSTSGGGEINNANDNSTDVLNIVSQADLAVTDSGVPATVAAGSTLVYLQTVTNSGPSDATGAVFTESIPANSIFQSISVPAGWSCTTPGAGATSGTITCTDPDFTAGSTSTFSLVLTAGSVSGNQIVNTVAVSSGVPDPSPANNTASLTATIGSNSTAALVVTDSVSPTSAPPATQVTYRPVVNNAGGAATTAVTFTEAVPANTTYISITPPSVGAVTWSCSGPSGGTVTCTSSTGLPVGFTGTFAMAVTVNAGTANGTALTDSAKATATTGGASTATATATVSNAPVATLAIADSVLPTIQAVGSNVTYYPVVTNSGSLATSIVTFTETLPSGSVSLFESMTAPAGWTCTTPAVGAASGTVSCTSSNGMAAGSSAAFALVLQAASGDATGTAISDSAKATATTGGTATASATATVEPSGDADVGVVLTAPANAAPSGAMVYSETVTNYGPVASSGVAVSLPLPTGTTYQSLAAPSGWACTNPGAGSNGTVKCSDTAALAANAVVSFSITANVASSATGTLTATATVSSTTTDPISANNTSAASTVVAAGTATLTIATTVPPAVYVGNNVAFTNIVTNTGPNPSGATTLTVAEPTSSPTGTSLTFQSVGSPAGWTCTTPAVGGTGSVVCTDSSPLASGAGVTIPVTYQVPLTTASATQFTGTGQATQSNSSNTVTSSATTTANSYVNLTVTNAAGSATVADSGSITYTQTVTNNGPTTSSPITLTEYLPTGTTFNGTSITVTPSPSGTGGTWTCPKTTNSDTGSFSCTSPPTLATAGSFTCTSSAGLASGASATIAMIATVGASTASGPVCEYFAASKDANEAYILDNIATAAVTVATSSQYDFALSLSSQPTSPSTSVLFAGSTLTDTFTITNNGPATFAYSATPSGTSGTVGFSFAIPANTTYSSIGALAYSGSGFTWSCSYTSPQVTCSFASGSMASGAYVTVPIVLTVSPAATVGTTIASTATITPSPADLYTNNNTVTVISPVAAVQGTLSWPAATATATVTAGSNITYTQTLENTGPSVATNVVVTDPLPANTTLNSFTAPTGWICTVPGTGTNGIITCTVASLGVGASNEVSFNPVVTVSASDTASPLSNTITASAGNAAGVSASESTTVTLSSDADLSLTNTASASTATAGTTITYTQVITNNGPATAPANSVVFTETLPPNMTYVNVLAAPAWTCTGGLSTGSVSCTDPNTMGTGSANSVTFEFELQINPEVPDGTVIVDTANVANTSSTAPDPNLSNNSATATVTVIDPNTASVTIGITGSPAYPSAVLAGNEATYTIQVTNGSSTVTATDVVLTDVLPETAADGTATEITFVSATVGSGTGTCSQGSGTITCQLGSMAPAASDTITVVVSTAVPTQYTNTASVVADQQTTPQSASAQTLVVAPTAIRLQSFIAGNSNGGVVLEWRTGAELHNLGFNVYRDVNGARVRVNPSLIAGSALRMRGALAKHAATSYSWVDRAPQPGAVYWLEDVDVHGARTLYGPAIPQSETELQGLPQARLLSQQARVTQPGTTSGSAASSSQPLQRFAQPTSTPAQQAVQCQIASGPATKIEVNQEGWYSIRPSSGVEAQAMALAHAADLHYYHLYAEGIEQPIRIVDPTTTSPGTIEFYGMAIDTPYSGSRVYWLVQNDTPSLEIGEAQASASGTVTPASFPYTIELKQRTTYFATLMTPGNHFFGDAVTSEPVSETLTVTNLANSGPAPVITVVLQGAVDQTEHVVLVALNGVSVGAVSFSGMNQGTLEMELPAKLLQDGANVVTLTALNGENDVSLLDRIDLQYAHTYTAESNSLKFTVAPGEHVAVSGFSQKPSGLIDITDPAAPMVVAADVVAEGSEFTLGFTVPSSLQGTRTFLAVTDGTMAKPQATTNITGSSWHAAQTGADVVMVSDPTFVPSLKSLAALHGKQGHSVAVVPIGDLYNEFNYGEKDPMAIRQFLQAATSLWQNRPRYLLLAGNASVDPRNYLGMGSFDFVPTMMVPTAELMTASDDSFSDFNNNGVAQIATGRLPVDTAEEAARVVSKIVNYESSSAALTNQVLFVADNDDTESFTQDTASVEALLPNTLTPTEVLATLSGSAAPQQIANDIGAGPLVVNYFGHGSEAQWSGGDLFDDTVAGSLTNKKLPVFLMMTCLNGFFIDVYQQSLAEAVLLSPDGGGVAVWASSGLLDPAPQVKMDRQLWQVLIANPSLPLGDAIAEAKATITDVDTLRTYILFGDPLLQVRFPVSYPFKPGSCGLGGCR